MPTRYSKEDWERVVFSRIKADSVLGCWEWTGGKTRDGYGCCHYKGSGTKIHRALYKHLYGDLPHHIGVLHKCDNRLCCNPFHWFVGTQQDNINDAVRKGRQPRAPGERHGCHILTDDVVIKMRDIARDTMRSHSDIAREFGFSLPTVSQAINGHSWKHLPGAVRRK